MIDFSLSENDRLVLDEVRRQALVCRKYARYYDEHEDEFTPDMLPEASRFKNPYKAVTRPDENVDTSLGVLQLLVAMGQGWGDYAVFMRRGGGGLGRVW